MNLLFFSCGASPTARKWTITLRLSGMPSRRDVRLVLDGAPGVAVSACGVAEEGTDWTAVDESVGGSEAVLVLLLLVGGVDESGAVEEAEDEWPASRDSEVVGAPLLCGSLSAMAN